MLRVDMDEWRDDPPDLYASIYLNQYRPWWKRIIPAFKYLFNFKPARCGFGHWDTWSMQYEDIDRLQCLLAEFKQLHEEWMDKVSRGVLP